MTLVAPVDFRPLAQLGDTFTRARTAADRRSALEGASLDSPEGLMSLGQRLASLGDLEGGLSLAKLGRERQQEDRQRAADEAAMTMLRGGNPFGSTQPGSPVQRAPSPMGGAPAGPFASVQSPGDPSLPAGMRNNNPGNIKFVPGVMRSHTGAVGPSVNTDQGDPQTVFETPELGMQSMYRLAMRRYEGGRRTPMQLIAEQGGWTPGNTAAAQNVARMMGIGPNDDMNLNDPAMAQRFARALTMQEHGAASRGYSDDMIRDQIQIVNEQRSGQRPFTPGPTGYGGEIARMAGVQGGAPVQVASVGAFTPASMPQGAQGGGQQVAQAGGMPQMGAAQMPPSMAELQRLRQSLMFPGTSQQMRTQIAAQIQALAPLVAAERQAMAPTELQKNYEAAQRQGFQGSLMDFAAQQRQSVTVNNNNSAERAEERARGEGLGKRLNDIAADHGEAEDLLFTTSRMEELSRAVEPGARTALMESIRQATGIRLDPNASNVHAFGSIVDYLTPRMRVPGSGASSDRDVALFKSSLPSLAGSPEGNAIIMQTVAGLARLRMERARVAQEWQEGRVDARVAGERIRSLPDPFAEFRSWRENAAAREQRPAQGRQPAAETTIPRVTTPEQHRALPPGTRYIAPDGREMIKR
jgi:hypothetical protein